MRERVTALGGTLTAGPRYGGGFRVQAILPLKTARTGEDSMTIRVLLADDQALLRSAFRVLVDSEPDMEVVGEAADGAEAVALARSSQAPTSS